MYTATYKSGTLKHSPAAQSMTSIVYSRVTPFITFLYNQISNTTHCVSFKFLEIGHILSFIDNKRIDEDLSNSFRSISNDFLHSYGLFQNEGVEARFRVCIRRMTLSVMSLVHILVNALDTRMNSRMVGSFLSIQTTVAKNYLRGQHFTYYTFHTSPMM